MTIKALCLRFSWEDRDKKAVFSEWCEIIKPDLKETVEFDGLEA